MIWKFRTALCLAVAANVAHYAYAATEMLVVVDAKAPNPNQSNSSLPSPSASQLPNGQQPDAATAVANRGRRVEGEPRGNPLWVIPLASLSATRERPLFTPSRRPPTPAAIANVEPARPLLTPPPVAEAPGLALIGLIAGEREGIAVFVNQATKEVVRLRTNEGYSGWILRSIKGREATLEKTPFTAVLTIPLP